MILKTIGYTLLTALTIFAGIVIWQSTAYRAEQPEYKVISKSGNIEIRQYPPLIIAKVTTEGRRYPAIQDGFRTLADFIFGENKAKQKISMTAPVMQQKDINDIDTNKTKQDWIVSFIMPKNFSLKNLPVPNNAEIQFETLPGRKYVVIQFSGVSTEGRIELQNKQLLEYIAKNKLQTRGAAILAYYNPPWILPFLRRNEIMYQLK